MKSKHILSLLFGLFFTVIVLRLMWVFGELTLKEECIQTQDNLAFVYRRLEQYHYEHGAYPPQQDMKSLLNTLGISKNNFEKTRFFDISSAEYHAPSLNPEDPLKKMDDPVLTLRVKSHVFGKDERLCLKRDGGIYSDYNPGTKP